MTLLYMLFAGVSQIAFMIVSGMFTLIDDLSKYNFFSADTINQFTNKVYVIIGVLMLFKLVISAVQYIVNPDMFDDKSKGLVAVLRKSIIAVILLAIVPSIFQFAMEVQGDIVEQIPKIIFGNRGTSVDQIGDQLSVSVMGSFLVVKDDKTGLPTRVLNGPGDFYAVAMDGCSANFLAPDFWSGDACFYNVWWILLVPIAGVFLIYILASLAIDVATRSIKFGIVQILAPIPITSYIVDEKKLTNWATTSVQIYTDLFIRLGIIYLIIYIVQVVLKDMFTNDGYDAFRNSVSQSVGRTPGGMELVLIKILIIVALLLFAKNAPKFITDLLGLKGAGDGFNDMFKRAGGLLGTTTAGLTSGLANYQNRMSNARNNWKKNGSTFGSRMRDRISAIGSAGAGTGSALFRGGRATINGKNMREAFNTGHRGAVTARQNREMDHMNDVHFSDRMRAKYQDFMGLDTDESLEENRQKAYATLHQDVGNFKKAAMGRYVKTANVAMVEGANTASEQLGRLLAQNMQAIMASGNVDLKNYLNKYQFTVDASGNVDLSSVKLKSGVHIGYHDLAAIHTDATQAGIGSIAGLTGENGALTLAAQKDLFTATMAGEVRDTAGNKIDALNVGSGKTHTDIDTAFQQANLHLAQNAVPLNGGNATELQEWFRGISPKHPGKDFGNMDDEYQQKSAKLSSEMATSSAARARESNKRHDANKQQNSGKK